MMKSMKRLLAAIFIAVALTGCAPWIRTGGPFTSQARNVTVDLPEGWMRLNTDDYILITRDGELLQSVLIEAFHVDETLKHTKKKLRRGMLPLEASEVIMDNISSNNEITSFEVKENRSAKVAGRQCFRALFTYRDREGLKIKSVYYGFLDGEWFYGIHYTAPQRHYFDRDIKTFEKIVASLRLAKTS